MEDEALMLRAAERILGTAGYVTLTAGSGPEAIRVYEENGGAVDLLLTDVVMPGMNGPELAEQLRRRAPALKVLFMSGYGLEEIREQGVEADAPFLGKPFSIDQLRAKVRAVLDG